MMRKLIIINGLALVVALVSNLANAAGESDEGSLQQDMGYFFGYSFGNILKEGGNQDIDINALMQGMKDSLELKFPELTREQQEAVIAAVEANRQARMAENEAARAAAQAQQGEMAETNLAAAMAFLKDNAKKDGVVATESGLQYMIIEEGDGEKPIPANKVSVHYQGRLMDGSIFDESSDKPVEFGLRQVIPGWTEGLQYVKSGGKIRLFVPPDLAYGPMGQGQIPPNALLIFDVELLGIK